MLQAVIDRLSQTATEPLGLILALALGVISAVTSACCTVPALGILAGYSSSQSGVDKRAAWRTTLFFGIGMVVALVALGAVAGFVGEVAQASLGRYWMPVAGVLAVFLGLATLKLLPFRMPGSGRLAQAKERLGRSGAIAAGLVLGGIVAISSLPCNPGIFLVVGVAVLQGAVIWASLLLACFAIGFTAPLSTVMLGISLGRVSLAARGADSAVRWLGGLLLILAGGYFLIMF